MRSQMIWLLAAFAALSVSACAPSVSEASEQTVPSAEAATLAEGDSSAAGTAQPEGSASAGISGNSAVAESAGAAVRYVLRDGVNLRSSAEDGENVIGTLNTGDAVNATGTIIDNRWVQVLRKGKKAYIAKEYISETKPEAVAAGNSAGGSGDAAEESAKTADGAANGAGSAAGGKSAEIPDGTRISLDPSWTYAGNSAIHTGEAVLCKASANRRGITVCVNAGHGCSGGESKKTLSHPDGSPKVTGGTNSAGAVKSMAISGGMQFDDGTPEAKVNLAVARKLRDKLLAAGYDVLMIRDGDDVQLDNIARTVIANNRADCHIAIHYDSTSSDKGAFFMSVPDGSYKSMEPVASHWKQHEKLGESLISGLKDAGVKIFSGGSMDMDLTQTSYSTIPSVDIEVGDKASSHADASLEKIADGLCRGVSLYFGD
ncbi:N-acetylmuramoyl-L-alanine amidase [Clostridium vitabionis]|uniref:N-acetylmuramoyl-L-alanine amidase n=1 Tax=Clostridium vitabionis TaxID=2784388 RepID=UPI001889DCAC|nr:N-acetylmuramoyl-L-alanine amidase [Clostridium vitabionis]